MLLGDEVGAGWRRVGTSGLCVGRGRASGRAGGRATSLSAPARRSVGPGGGRTGPPPESGPGRIIPRDVVTAARAAHPIRVRRGVPVPPLPRSRPRLRRRLDAGARVRDAAVLAVALFGGILLRVDKIDLLGFVVQPAVLYGLFVVNAVALLYRVIAAVDAWQVARFLNEVDASGGGRLGRPKLPVSPLSIAGLSSSSS